MRSHRLSTHCHLFSYIKRDERQREKEERNKRENRKKIEIRLSLFQMAITFDRKLRLRRATQSHKAYDEIYRVNYLCCYRHFQGKKNSSSSLRTHLKF
jgi:hypothetical protein